MTDFIAYRCAARDTPFSFDPNPEAGRYNREGEAPTTYLGLHPLTPWAEMLRAFDLRTDEEIVQLRPPTWAVRISLEPDDIVELSFDAPGPLVPDDLVDDDMGPCQAFAVGLRAASAEPNTIIAPSAALPGTRNLILLGARVLAPYLVEPVDPVIDTPGTLTAVRGRAPLNLAPLVHHRRAGVPHPGLAAWRAGERLELREPALRSHELGGVAERP